VTAIRELARENIEYGEQAISMWKELGKQLEKLDEDQTSQH